MKAFDLASFKYFVTKSYCTHSSSHWFSQRHAQKVNFLNHRTNHSSKFCLFVSLSIVSSNISKMENERPEEKDSYIYYRTTCGLLSFILSFLMAFFSFIVAEEAGPYYEYAIIFGFVMLFITSLIFCYVMHESKRVYSTPTQPSDWLPIDPSVLQAEQQEESQPEPESSIEAPQVPLWRDRTRHDYKYVRCVLGLPAGDSDETLGSAIDHEYETIPLRRISKPGFDSESKGSTSENSNPYQDAESRWEDATAADVHSYSPKPGPSRISGKGPESIESKTDASTLESIASLSLSDSSEIATGEKQIEKAISKLSLDDSEKQAAEMVKSSTHAEDKSDKDDPSHDDDKSDKDDPSHDDDKSDKDDSSHAGTTESPRCELN